MTKPDAAPRPPNGPRCAYCRRPLASAAGLDPSSGRPRKYCRRSHRQRAYEARRRASRAALPDGQVVVAQSELDALHDRLYALEATLDDVANDLADLRPSSPERVRARTYADALDHLRTAAEDLRGVVVEPLVT
ncbi:MAG TPA: hypothetical protein VMD28_01570 [Acidimicrobiales bacterium]|nr:hypothetical protein [Acidimicrobiales bacterium]